MKKILLIIAHQGFQPSEYGEPKRILQLNDVEVITASNKLGEAVSSLAEERVKVDLILEDVVVDDYDGIFLIGGSGALECLDNKATYRIVREAQAKDKLFGAICISPRILAKAGVLFGKKATGWDDDNQLTEILTEAGSDYIKKPVVVDGKLITAWGPNAAEEFGKVILERL